MKKHIIVFALLSIFAHRALGQNLITVDSKFLHFGFTLGLDAMDFGISPSLVVTSKGVYEADVAKVTPGFTVGVIGDMRLGEYFNLRTVPAMHFGQRELSFVNLSANKSVERLNIKSNILTVPLYIKYSAVRVSNYRPHLIAGGGVAFDFGREREQPVLLNTLDYFVDFGVGWTNYFPYFRLSPEIKFALGFGNIITPLERRTNDFIADENLHFTRSIDKLTSRLLTFTLNFE